MNALFEMLSYRPFWSVVGGFYLVAYAFWLPSLFPSVWFLIAFWVLAVGGVLLYAGFNEMMSLELWYPKTSWKRPLHFYDRDSFYGGVSLIPFSLIYLYEQNRIVPHWPLDLLVTVLSGILLIYYAVRPHV